MNILKDFVCDKCFNTMKRCKCNNNPFTLIQIDRSIQKIIRTLNIKGYKTMYCCEGHYDNNGYTNTYIYFKQPIKTKAPNGFTWRRNGLILEHIYELDKMSKSEFENQKKEYLKNLKEWSEKLI